MRAYEPRIQYAVSYASRVLAFDDLEDAQQFTEAMSSQYPDTSVAAVRETRDMVTPPIDDIIAVLDNGAVFVRAESTFFGVSK